MALAEFNGDGNPDLAFIDHDVYEVLVFWETVAAILLPLRPRPSDPRTGTIPTRQRASPRGCQKGQASWTSLRCRDSMHPAKECPVKTAIGRSA